MGAQTRVGLTRKFQDEYDIVEYAHIDKNFSGEQHYIVLRDLKHGLMPWVTHEMAVKDTVGETEVDFFWGHYHIVKEQAEADFVERVSDNT